MPIFTLFCTFPLILCNFLIQKHVCQEPVTVALPQSLPHGLQHGQDFSHHLAKLQRHWVFHLPQKCPPHHLPLLRCHKLRLKQRMPLHICGTTVGKHFAHSLFRHRHIYFPTPENRINIKEILHPAVAFSTVNHRLEFLSHHGLKRIGHHIHLRHILQQQRIVQVSLSRSMRSPIKSISIVGRALNRSWAYSNAPPFKKVLLLFHISIVFQSPISRYPFSVVATRICFA